MIEEMHKDVQELMEFVIDIDTVRNKSTYLVDKDNKRWVFDRSYRNPVGVETFVLKNF